jgi:hypothetical protein
MWADVASSHQWQVSIDPIIATGTIVHFDIRVVTIARRIDINVDDRT